MVLWCSHHRMSARPRHSLHISQQFLQQQTQTGWTHPNTGLSGTPAPAPDDLSLGLAPTGGDTRQAMSPLADDASQGLVAGDQHLSPPRLRETLALVRSELSAERDRADRHERAAETFKSQHATLSGRVATAERDLRAAQTRIAELEAAAEQAQTLEQRLREELTAAEQAHDTGQEALQTQLDQAQTAAREQETRAGTAERALQASTARIAELEAAAEQAQTLEQRLREELTAAEQAHDTGQEALQTQLDQAQTAAREQETRAGTAERALQASTARIAELEAAAEQTQIVEQQLRGEQVAAARDHAAGQQALTARMRLLQERVDRAEATATQLVTELDHFDDPALVRFFGHTMPECSAPESENRSPQPGPNVPGPPRSQSSEQDTSMIVTLGPALPPSELGTASGASRSDQQRASTTPEPELVQGSASPAGPDEATIQVVLQQVLSRLVNLRERALAQSRLQAATARAQTAAGCQLVLAWVRDLDQTLPSPDTPPRPDEALAVPSVLPDSTEPQPEGAVTEVPLVLWLTQHASPEIQARVERIRALAHAHGVAQNQLQTSEYQVVILQQAVTAARRRSLASLKLEHQRFRHQAVLHQVVRAVAQAVQLTQQQAPTRVLTSTSDPSAADPSSHPGPSDSLQCVSVAASEHLTTNYYSLVSELLEVVQYQRQIAHLTSLGPTPAQTRSLFTPTLMTNTLPHAAQAALGAQYPGIPRTAAPLLASAQEIPARSFLQQGRDGKLAVGQSARSPSPSDATERLPPLGDGSTRSAGPAQLQPQAFLSSLFRSVF